MVAMVTAVAETTVNATAMEVSWRETEATEKTMVMKTMKTMAMVAMMTTTKLARLLFLGVEVVLWRTAMEAN
jgi:hypothetical protein